MTRIEGARRIAVVSNLRKEFGMFDELMSLGGKVTECLLLGPDGEPGDEVPLYDPDSSYSRGMLLKVTGRADPDDPRIRNLRVKVSVGEAYIMAITPEDGLPEPSCVTADRLASVLGVGPEVLFTEWREVPDKDGVYQLRYAFCMEDYGHGDLYDWLTEVEDPGVDAVAVFFYNITALLRELRDAGFSHGDVKLENVIVEDPDKGAVRLIDFELARPIELQPGRNDPCDERWCFRTSGSVSGTETCMPPEKVAQMGKPGGCDHRIDTEKETVYCLGLSLTETLTWNHRLGHAGPAAGIPRRMKSLYESVLPHVPTEHPFFKNKGLDPVKSTLRDPEGLKFRRDVLLRQRLADLCRDATHPDPAQRPSLDGVAAAVKSAVAEHRKIGAEGSIVLWQPCVRPSGRPASDPLYPVVGRPCPARPIVLVAGHHRGWPHPAVSGRSHSCDLRAVDWVPTRAPHRKTVSI